MSSSKNKPDETAKEMAQPIKIPIRTPSPFNKSVSTRTHSTDTEIHQTNEKPLTAEELKFSSLVAQGYTLTKAYRAAFPSSKGLHNNTVRRYASVLYSKNKIVTEVETKQAKNAYLARLAEDRLEEQLTDGRNEKVTSDVAMFMYDHANGKATQRIEQRTEAITLNIDLTGTGTPVLDQ